jgi:translation initiation factor 5B
MNKSRGFCTESVIKEEIKIVEKKVEGVEINETIRAPICCVMGHVDAGKTSFLDKIRQSNYQSKEAGGITQNISSTYFPIEHIREVTKNIKGKFEVTHTIPGLLIIDTPGHEEFYRLRERGSSICDLGIVIVDIEKSIEPQTLESIKLLKENKVPFIIVANKLDTIDNWKTTNNMSLKESLKEQDKLVGQTLEFKLEDLKYDMSKLDITSEFYVKNKTPEKTYSIIPMSSRTGEGIADVFSLLVFLTQNWMTKKLTQKDDKFKAIVMESVKDKHNGWVIDVILINGQLSKEDKFAISTFNGPVISTIRNILIPENLKPLGTKTNWTYVNNIKAARGIRIIGSNLENVIAGTQLHILNDNTEEQKALDSAKEEISKYWNTFEWKENGVFILTKNIVEQEALYNLLNKNSINITYGILDNNILNEKNLNIIATMTSNQKFNEYRVLLCFGKLDDSNNIRTLAKEKNIHLIESEVMYQLLEDYKKFKEDELKKRKEEETKKGEVVFPVQLSILKKFIFLKGGSDNLLFGVKVKKGKLILNTPIIVPKKNLILGKVTSIEKNHKPQKEAKEGEEVCIRLSNDNHYSYDRQFDSNDHLVSHITRDVIDVLKRDFRDVLNKSDWLNIMEIKEILEIK